MKQGHGVKLNTVVAPLLLSLLSLPGCDPGLTGDEIVWVTIPAGGFFMGCSPGDTECDKEGWGYGETPRHWVDVPAFEMARTETTQYQYWQVTGDMPSYHPRCGNCPVEYMENHFHDAAAFCAAVGGRLPSEAEWEYAARAGTTTRYYCVDNAACISDIAWYRSNSAVADGTLRPHPVATKEPNAFGLYDMSGNLQEWTADCSHPDFTGAPVDGSAWITGGDCAQHVFKGGSYNSEPAGVRSSWRYWDFPDTRGIADGFRCARDVGR
ncbi:MAG TPA: formylglycine-generating enzyme family protein [Myxococcota bacterium]|nr:formylglycine-generating enzyme family protein [Myxococcota bacterium]